jgi:hypothetical protein
MHVDEKAIMDYLKAWPHTFVSGREIARKVGGKRRYAEDRGWAIPVLSHMIQVGLIDTDNFGHFRLKSNDKKKKDGRHVSPQILRILKSSGKTFEGVVIDEDTEDSAEKIKPAVFDPDAEPTPPPDEKKE